ncbi:MAG: MFS transporter [Desulfobacteraceae bacterium]|nr:MFS transporter [Desulfobacteraceae bacterium]
MRNRFWEKGRRTPEKDLSTIFLVLAISVAVSNLGIGIISPLLPVYAKRMGADGVLVGLIFSSFSISRLIFMPVAGGLSDRYGRKSFLMTGLSLYALCSVAYIVAVQAWYLIGVRFLQGMASAMILPIAMAALADLSPSEKAGEAVGSFNTPIYIGLGFGPLLGGVIADWVGIEFNFLIMGLLSLVSLSLVAAFVPRIGERKKKAPIRIGSWGLLKDATFRSVFMLRFALSVGLGVMSSFLPLLGVMEIGLSMAAVGVCIAVKILTVAVLMRPFGKLADKKDKVKLSVLGTCLNVVALLGATAAGSLLQLLAVCVVWGFGSALAVPAMTALVIARGKDLGVGMGRAMGLFNMALSAGMAVGPIALGKFYDLMKPSGAFFAAAVAVCLGIVVFVVSIKSAGLSSLEKRPAAH